MATSLSSVLASIPGYGAYLAKREMNEQAGMDDLKRASVLQGIYAQMQQQEQGQQERQRAEALRAAIAALPPEKRTRENVLPLVLMHASNPAGAAMQLPATEVPRSQPIGAGGLLKPDGTIVPPAARPAPPAEPKAPPVRQRYDGTNVIQEELQPDGTWKQIGSGPRFQPAKPEAPAEAKARPTRQRFDGDKVIQEELQPDGTWKEFGRGPRSTATERPMNEFQGKSTLYGTRAAQSDKVLRALEDKISTTGLSVKQAVSRTPLVGGILGAAGNVALSTEQQRVEQAQRDFVNAVLRQESGAVISDAEFANAQKQYFPAPGDDAATIRQKRANRKLAIQGFARMSGAGAADIEAIANDPLLPGSDEAGKATLPPKNAKGWNLMIDAKGNKAYVGPNGEIEEVR